MKKRKNIIFLMALSLVISLMLIGCEPADDVSDVPSDAASGDESNDVSELSQEPTVDFDFEKFSDAIKNTLELDDIDCEGESFISYLMGGMDFELSDAYKIKMTHVNGNIVASIDETTTLAGLESQRTSYYADGYLYTAVGDQKTKHATSFDELNKSFIPLKEIPEDIIDSASEEDEDGTKYYILTLDEEELLNSPMFDSLKEKLHSTMGTDDISFEFESVEVKTAFGDDYIDYYEISGAIKVSVETDDTSSLEIPVDFSFFVKVNNPGGDVEVTEPDDLDEYMDVA